MTVTATCHCGGFQIELPEAPAQATRCTCTYCTKSGGLWAAYPAGAARIVRDEFGAIYSKTGFNQHHFCSRCGCQTYQVTPDWTTADIGASEAPKGTRFSINARLVDDFVAFKGMRLLEIDGRNLW